MSIIFSYVGILVFIGIVISYAAWSRQTPLGGLSLPCVTLLTTLIYFFLMPAAFIASGERAFFGVTMTDLDDVYLAVALYVGGAICAFYVGRRSLARSPLVPTPLEPRFSVVAFRTLFVLSLLAIITRIYLGGISLSGDDAVNSYSGRSQTSSLNFLNLGYSVLTSLIVIRLLRTRFSLPSLAFLGFVILIFLIEGSRFRIVILLSSVLMSFLLVHRIVPRTWAVAAGSVIAITLLNAIALTRTYGRGLTLDRIEGMSLERLFSSFNGEVGPVFTLYNVVEDPPKLIYFEPWVNAITGFVPTFLWPNKPYPQYLSLYADGFPDIRARTAGIAATQQTEFLLQFGWIGLPILAFIFFGIAALLLRRISKLGFEGRVAGYAMIPTLFGFYAQQRGYTFQVVAEVLFTIGPLLLLYKRNRRMPSGSPVR